MEENELSLCGQRLPTKQNKNPVDGVGTLGRAKVALMGGGSAGWSSSRRDKKRKK